MKYEITTQQGKNYIVSDDSAWLWIELERELGFTVTQAAEKMSQGSLDVITCMLFKAAKQGGHTELKTQKSWVEHEFDSFEVLDEDPKAS
jgi:hypothetical protein